MKKLSVVLLGAGIRGIIYTDLMAGMQNKYEVIAVAEPNESRRNYIKDKHGIADEQCFTDWRPLLAQGKIADVALISTMDKDHFELAMKAISLGYDLLLEKPIAPAPEECEQIMAYAEEKGVKVVICTVLRYTPIFVKLKELIDSGRIGKVMTITHEECVGNHHHSHSFVRGNWGNEEKSSFMLLQKSCHDIDLLQWLIDKQCKKVQSFGALSYFKKENAPEGAPDYCIDGCPVENCRYNAVRRYLYLENNESPWSRIACTGNVDPSDDVIKDSLRNTQYGKCVYKCDNNVVDHQTVNLLFEDDVTVTFNMNAFNKGGRFIHVMGTDGEIRAALDGETPIMLYDFTKRETEHINMSAKDGIANGHGGGDAGIIQALYEYLTGTYTGNSIPEIRQSSTNHLIVFAAEESRKNNTVVDFDEYLKKFRK